MNSFGFGGTNSHVILSSVHANSSISTHSVNGVNGINAHATGSVNGENGTARIKTHGPEQDHAQLFCLSAKSKASLLRTTENLREWISKRKPSKGRVRDLAYTLSSRRSLMSNRATFVASSADSLYDALQHPRVTKVAANFLVTWLFTGQGAQWSAMGRELIDTPTFGRSLIRSENILKKLGTSWSLIEELRKGESESRINESQISQPATTAIQLALVDLLRALGVVPNAVLGHSSGEIAAAYGAGILSQESALKVSYHRSFISAWCHEDVEQKGAMLAVGLGEDDVSIHIAKIQTGTAVVACVNSPASTTVSGDQSAILELQQILDRYSIFNRRLKVDTAYHSHHMRAVATRYLRSLGMVKASSPNTDIKFFSSVTGQEKTSNFGASYWVENLVSKVRFSVALQTLATSPCRNASPLQLFLELGPHSALQGPFRQSLSPLGLDPMRYAYLPTLIRDKNSQVTILELAGKIFERGYSVDLQLANSLNSDALTEPLKVVTDLPSYAWNREKYWHESRLSREYRFREHPYHDLLGLRLISGNLLEPTWCNVLSIDALPWLNEHIIDNFALLPGSSFLCMAMEAMRQLIHDRKVSGTPKKFVIRNVSFSKALVIPDAPGKIEVQLSFRQVHGSGDKINTPWEEFCVTALTADSKTWNEHCRGLIMAEFAPSDATQDDDFADVEARAEEEYSAIASRERLANIQKNCNQKIHSATLYKELRENGIDYGSTFASISTLHIGPCQAIGTVILPDVAAVMPSKFMQPHVIHPATFDALMHIVLPLYSRHCSKGPVMLTSIGEATVAVEVFNRPGQELLVACSLSPAGPRSGTVDVEVFQGNGGNEPVVTLSREEFRGLGESTAGAKGFAVPRDPAYHMEWIDVLTEDANDERPLTSVKIMHNTTSFQKDLAQDISVAFGEVNIESTMGNFQSTAFGDEMVYLIIDSALQPLLADPSPIQLGQINKLFKEARLVIWATIQDDNSRPVNPEKDIIRGFARVARSENKDLQLTTLEIWSNTRDILLLVKTISRLISKLKEPGPRDYDYIYRDGVLSVPRLTPRGSFNSFVAAKVDRETTDMGLFHHADRPLKIHIGTPGLLESLVFVDDNAARAPLGPGKVEIEVFAHSVNQVDVKTALGRTSSQMVGECAGVICNLGPDVPSDLQIGDRVCGWGANSSYGSNMRLDHGLIQKLPASLSFEQGASIPYAFETAYFGLVEIANLQKGQSVLIHSGAGGVGQAALMLAKHIGAEIFVTVSSSSKQHMLIEKFGLSKSSVFSSRSKTFKQGILRATSGQGVDVVFNTLGESEILHETWECVATFGTFLNIGSLSGQLSVKPFASSITFSSINMSLMAQHRPSKVGRLLEKIMAMFGDGSLRPIYPITAMPMAQIADAFRLIQHRKHSGKVVLTADKTTTVKQKITRLPALQLDKSGTYLIAADIGTDGLVTQICHFMISHGAGNIVLLLDSHTQEVVVRSVFTSAAEKINIIMCDITHRKKVRAAIVGLESIKGAVQISSASQDYPIDGTRFLVEALSESGLDFFIMISSITHALGLGGEGSSSGGAAFQQAFANSQNSSRTHFMSVSVSSKIETEVLQSLLEYSMSGAARSDGCQQLFIGINKDSLSQQNPAILVDAIFNTLEDSKISEPLQGLNTPKSTSQLISAARSLHEAQSITIVALTEQLSSLVALEVEDITLNQPIEEIGLDSLVAIEFKNWIGKTFSANMQTSEILDAANLQELAKLIVVRSPSVANNLPRSSPKEELPELVISKSKIGVTTERQHGVSGHSSDQSSLDQISSASSDMSISDQSTAQSPVSMTPSPLLKLPRQPLPDLESTLQYYLTSVRSFCSTKELENTRAVIEDFLKPSGLGRQLQDRLLARYNDPNIENWVAELYLASGFLERRVQLVPFSSFFFGHQLSTVSHTQAERSAVISTAALKFKQMLEAGQIQPEILNEQPTCMELFQWIFNAHRKPCIRADVMEKFPGNDYLIALKNGRVFKVMLTRGRNNISFEDLRNIFEVILNQADDEVLWTGILTADERNSWAKIREQVKEVNETNKAYLHVIEAAAFVVCLDNASPTTMVERAALFHFGDGSNRWNDKSIQFVVCANGCSGFIGDHTMLDAGTVHSLNDFINSAILDFRPEPRVNGYGRINYAKLEELPFTSTPEIENHINRVRKQFNESIMGIEHAFFTYTDFGGTFLREHKIAPKSAFQIIVLLAAQDLFGYVPALWETVSVSNFHQGRIDINQIVLPPVMDFCAVFKNLSVPVSIRQKLFVEAIKAHANSVTRASRGRGIDRHLSALRQVLKRGEPLPALFQDPIYSKTRPRKIMAHCHETGMLEKGFVLRDPEAIWVHYELGDNE